MPNKLNAKFIVLDGPDGCGKSTQTRMLCEWITGQGVTVHTFRDPGDTAIGERIREVLLSPEHDAMATMTEFLLYMAARTQLWAEKIAPALEASACVVLDRWLSSTYAYQGIAGGFGGERVLRIATDSLERVWPDVTIVLDVDGECARQRMDRQLDRMELKGDAYHQRVREGFLALAETRDDFSVVDARLGIDEVHAAVIQAVESTMEDRS
jgi:dTMP kinase